ncbi:PIN domain-containing protein [Pseudoduganella sp. LjRoot289]|uniref:PIN domain-containing protein n=1 Tax=Pseudoduganella sp. LjRoot289 TaxID=3342314 RepID=UPI003ECCF4F8
MVKVIFDTNILIDHFDGIKEALDELARYDDVAISTITWSEVMSLPAASSHELEDMRAVMRGFVLYDVDAEVAEEAAAMRRAAKAAGVRIPKTADAIVLATARLSNRRLISRDTRAFSPVEIHVPYKLEKDKDGNVLNLVPLPLIEKPTGSAELNAGIDLPKQDQNPQE